MIAFRLLKLIEEIKKPTGPVKPSQKLGQKPIPKPVKKDFIKAPIKPEEPSIVGELGKIGSKGYADIPTGGVAGAGRVIGALDQIKQDWKGLLKAKKII